MLLNLLSAPISGFLGLTSAHRGPFQDGQVTPRFKICWWLPLFSVVYAALWLPQWLSHGVKNLPAMQEPQEAWAPEGLIPGLGRSPGGGHGNPLQDSCLEDPMDRRAWRATEHRVVNSYSQTWLKQLTMHAHTHAALAIWPLCLQFWPPSAMQSPCPGSATSIQRSPFSSSFAPSYFCTSDISSWNDWVHYLWGPSGFTNF